MRPIKNPTATPAKEKILNSALGVIRAQGYSSTTVDELCAAAGVTKGTFFHYFPSKEALAVAAAHHWSAVTEKFFESAYYHKQKDPLARLLGYINFRKEILSGKISEFTCLVGTMVQETFETHPEIQKACRESIFDHARKLESDIDAAKILYVPGAKWSSKSLALYTQAAIQGAYILAKAGGDAKFAADAIDHLENYIQFLFNQKKRNREGIRHEEANSAHDHLD